MPQVHIPASLRSHSANQAVVTVEGATVGEVLENVFELQPELRTAMMSDSQQIHPFFNLFVGEDNIRDLQNLGTPLSQNQILLIVPALAGG